MSQVFNESGIPREPVTPIIPANPVAADNRDHDLPRFVARPVEVTALKIVKVERSSSKKIPPRLVLENGQDIFPDKGMVARYLPQRGDYVVVQADGYIYLNPAKVFERKYQRQEDAAPAGQSAEDIARICHELNRLYCLGLGDSSQVSWDEAPDWQRASAIKGVEFHMAHPEADASNSHESWFADKAAAGWTYGEVKDPEAKTHPCMVPFDELPPEQQYKDIQFKTIVDAALGR